MVIVRLAKVHALYLGRVDSFLFCIVESILEVTVGLVVVECFPLENSNKQLLYVM